MDQNAVRTIPYRFEDGTIYDLTTQAFDNRVHQHVHATAASVGWVLIYSVPIDLNHILTGKDQDL